MDGVQECNVGASVAPILPKRTVSHLFVVLAFLTLPIGATSRGTRKLGANGRAIDLHYFIPGSAHHPNVSFLSSTSQKPF